MKSEKLFPSATVYENCAGRFDTVQIDPKPNLKWIQTGNQGVPKRVFK